MPKKVETLKKIHQRTKSGSEKLQGSCISYLGLFHLLCCWNTEQNVSCWSSMTSGYMLHNFFQFSKIIIYTYIFIFFIIIHGVMPLECLILIFDTWDTEIVKHIPWSLMLILAK